MGEHDLLFKAVFSEPANAVAHFEVCLPPVLVTALDMSKAEHVPGSWVDEKLSEHHSDVLHSIPLRNAEEQADGADRVLLYTIWEHQSTVDQMITLKAHRYTTRLLEQWNREHPGERLPPVLAMILYHGESEWNAPLELGDLFALDGIGTDAREALLPYLPKQRLLLEVVPEDPSAVRSAAGITRMTLVGLKRARTVGVSSLIVDVMPDIEVERAKGKRGLHYIGLFCQYVLLVNPEANIENLSEALKTMGSEVQELPKTYGRRLIEEGENRAKRDLARKLLAKGNTPAEVAELTELSLEEVQSLTH